MPTQGSIDVGGVSVATVRGGSGAPVLVLHDELGYPGWMTWNEELSANRELVIPMQPGYGQTPRLDWVRSYRDLAGFYARMVREQGWAPLEVIGFSAGAYIAAEMAAACPEMFSKVVLVGPLGLRPTEGEIFDFLAVTIRTHVAATVSKLDAPEFGQIYGGEMTPHQFEAFEDARAETARIGWEPFMFNDSLPHLLEGMGDLPVMLVWGDQDLIAPRGCIEAYERCVPNSTTVAIAGVGHRPEIEDPQGFLGAVNSFLGI
jgi:pimeloyl-ACP methyl ester carboxylesterase